MPRERPPASEGSNLDQSIGSASGHFKRSSHTVVSFTSDEGEVRYPANLTWTCIGCANSCRDLPGRKRNILLVPSDTKRISSATKLTAQEFSLSSPGTVPYDRKMKKHKGKCIFLQGSRCSIYRARPLICRFYPFSLRSLSDGTLEVGFDPSCSGIGKGPSRGEKLFHDLVTLARKELGS